MPYEFNPLLRDGLQKKSPVSPADIQTLQAEISELQESSENLKQKKVTKFFSANDTLENNEIAQYQGEDDAVNNLRNGFFYKVTISESLVEKEVVTYNPYYYANINKVFPADESAKVYNNDFKSERFGNYTKVTFIINGDRTETFDILLFPITDNYFTSKIIIDSDAVTVFDLQGTGLYYMSQFAICTTGARQWQRFQVLIQDNNVLINNIIATPVGWSKNIENQFTTEFSEYNNKIYPTVSINAAYKLYYLRPITYPIPVDEFIIIADYRENNFYRFPHDVAEPLSVQTFEFEDVVSFQRTNTQPALIWSAYDSNDSEPRFINLDSITALENIKFSYTPSNDYYITYDNLIARQGKPDIRYLDYCIINSLGAIYTHGQFLLANKSVDDYQYNGSVYGVQWNTEDTSPECTRIGNLSLHATLPVHNQIVGGLLTDDGTFSPFSNQTDWTTETRDGSLGQVMVKIPEFWYKFITEGPINKVLFSAVPVLGFKKSPEMFISAYEAALDRVNLKLSSVVNNSVNFRGGNNIAAWDNTYRELLGRPVSNINLTNFRTYARNRHTVDGNPDTRWNCMTYEAQRLLYWLFVVEFATLNTQKPFDAELTGEGFKQGGLGNGVSMWTDSSWNSFNAYNPFVPCGYTDEFGNTTNIKTYNVIDVNNNILYAAEVPRYRGIENPFAHIWQWTDGILVEVSAQGNSSVFIQTDCDKFSSVDYSEYEYIGNQVRSENFIKGIIFGSNGDIIANKFAGNSATYYCDYYYGSNLPSSGVSVRGCRFGGRAGRGAQCGLVYGLTHNAPVDADVAVGSRLCFKA